MNEPTFPERCADEYVRAFCKTAGALSAFVVFAAFLPKSKPATATIPTP